MAGTHVGVAKAAHLLGISRHELQKLMRNGELHAFEGQLDLDELRARFPAIALEEAAIMEEVRLIRATAFGRRVRETVTPDKEELQQQIGKRNKELSVEQERAKRYRAILDDLLRMLGTLQCGDDPRGKEVVLEISRWLVERMGDGEGR